MPRLIACRQTATFFHRVAVGPSATRTYTLSHVLEGILPTFHVGISAVLGCGVETHGERNLADRAPAGMTSLGVQWVSAGLGYDAARAGAEVRPGVMRTDDSSAVSTAATGKSRRITLSGYVHPVVDGVKVAFVRAPRVVGAAAGDR